MMPVVYGLALAPVLADSVPLFLGAAVLIQWICVWVPLLSVFDRGENFYLKRPNPYDDMYDDERSRHWITPAED